MMMVLVLMLLAVMSKEMIELLVKLMDADGPCWLPLVVILKGWECNDYNVFIYTYWVVYPKKRRLKKNYLVFFVTEEKTYVFF